MSGDAIGGRAEKTYVAFRPDREPWTDRLGRWFCIAAFVFLAGVMVGLAILQVSG